jgi:DNA-binding transcriptional LysR family regulator
MPAPMLGAALAGAGLAYLPDDDVQPYPADGRLVRVLSDWCPSYPGDHLYYPSRRQPTSAVSLR